MGLSCSNANQLYVIMHYLEALTRSTGLTRLKDYITITTLRIVCVTSGLIHII